MKQATSLVVGLAFALIASYSARAQVTLDVTKITCNQFVTYKITNPQYIAVWLSGYYHGKRGSTTVDTQALLANAKKAQEYCLKNPEILLMTAVEKILGD